MNIIKIISSLSRKERISGIYKITNPENKVYVGQSINLRGRFLKYNSIEKTKEQPRIIDSFNKFGIENHCFEIIEICPIDQLYDRERYWQEFYNVLEHGLNCQMAPTKDKVMIVSESTKKKIGDGNRGKTLSAQSRMLISKNHSRHNLGKNISEETKQKIRDFNLGKKLSKETKEKMSISRSGNKHYLYGKKMPKEQRDKMAITKKERYHPKNHGMAKKLINTETLEIHDCVKEVAGMLKINIDRFRKMMRGQIENKTNFKYYINDKRTI